MAVSMRTGYRHSHDSNPAGSCAGSSTNSVMHRRKVRISSNRLLPSWPR